MSDIRIETRHFAKKDQRVLVLEPAKPNTCIIAFPGFDGDIDLEENVPRKLTYNFFVRNRMLFAKLGYLVVIVDSPQSEKSIGLKKATGNRRSAAAVDSFHELFDFLQLPRIPAWLCGTSRSPETILAICNRPKHPFAGAVLLSCLTADNDGATSITKVPVDHVVVPVLVVHHALDQCSVANPKLIPIFIDRLPSVRKKLVLVEAGYSAEGADVCKGNALHGFWGADQEVVTVIDDFIRGGN